MAAATFAAAVLIVGAIIYIQTDKGEFVIETRDENIAVMVNEKGGQGNGPTLARKGYVVAAIDSYFCGKRIGTGPAGNREGNKGAVRPTHGVRPPVR